MPEGRDADPARVVDLHLAGDRVVIAVVEDAVPGRAAAGHHGGPGRGRHGRDRSSGASREAAPARKASRLGISPRCAHRVEHGPGRAVQAQDDQSIDGLRHDIGSSTAPRSGGGSAGNPGSSGCGVRSGFRGSSPAGEAGLDVDVEIGRVVVGRPGAARPSTDRCGEPAGAASRRPAGPPRPGGAQSTIRRDQLRRPRGRIRRGRRLDRRAPSPSAGTCW